LDICVGAYEFLVTPLLMGPVCLLSQGRFEEPVRSFLSSIVYLYCHLIMLTLRHFANNQSINKRK